MIDMDVFENAFEFFLRTGRFELNNSKLSIKQLLLIKEHLQNKQELPSSPHSKVDHYSIQ